MTQEYTSAKSSKNKIPSLFKSKEFVIGKAINFDLGGGKFDTATEYLATRGVKNLVYDPYNRTVEHNTKMLNMALSRPFMTVTCLNVLNVIKEKDVRLEVLKLARNIARGETIYILVYEGDKSGIGKVTKCGWQQNTITQEYLSEIKLVFNDNYNFSVNKNLITIYGY